MTESNEAPATVATAFAFARQLRDPQLRDRLRAIGWTNGMDVIPTSDAETIYSLAKRIALDARSGTCLIVWESPIEPSGFAVMFAEPVPADEKKQRWPGPRRPEILHIQPASSVGMVYAHLKGCADFFPSEWIKPVRFLATVTS